MHNCASNDGHFEEGAQSGEVALGRKRGRREPVALEQLPKDVWLVGHVAQALGMSTSWVYKQVAAQAIPHTKRTGMLRFDPARVMEWAKGGDSGGVVVPLRAKGSR